ncbi:caspase domain-containing protein, partial [Fibrobacterota bacterium]
MNIRSSLTAVLVLAIAAACPAVPATDSLKLKRMALIVGVNYGGKDRVILKYAQSDAKAFARVMRELGGIDKSDLTLLLEPTAADFKKALQKIHEKLKTAGPKSRRVEMVMYYSGHADAQGMLLGGEKMTYKEVKTAIKQMPADIRIAVLDACAAGAMTRLKGGKKQPAFLMDESSDMKGHAFLTSNTADEAAQESDQIQGSFFTHSLVSGLRGAADLTNDGRVTLNEAYQYAFHETLARTEETQAGPQHAGADMRLSGTGEVVMTDLRGTSATLEMDEAMDGRVFVRDKKGVLVVELRKYKGRQVELGLEPGKYQVILEKEGPLFKADVQVDKGKTSRLADKDLKPIKGELTVARGGPAPGAGKDLDSLSIAESMKLAARAVGSGIGKAVHKVKVRIAEATADKEKPAGELKDDVSNEKEEPADISQDGISSEKTEPVKPKAEYDTIPVSFAVFPSLHKRKGKLRLGRVYHNYSINLFAGAYHKLDGLGVGLLGQWAVEEVNGTQVSLLLNFCGGQVKGFQASTGINLAGKVKGAQASAFLNAAADVKGGQGAAFGNFARDVDGGQGAAFGNFARNVKGGQGAAFANFAR